MNADCIRKGNISDRTGVSKEIFRYLSFYCIHSNIFDNDRYVNFDGRVGVPGELWDVLLPQMREHPEIQWEVV